MDMADFKGVQMQFEADEEQAMREHDRLMDGGVVNQQAAMRAQEELMMAMLENPEAPLDPELMQRSVDAGFEPLPFENKASHLEAHAAFMKSAEFEAMPSEQQQVFYKHFELTQAALMAEEGPNGDAPRVSLQLRGAVGPTTGSKILNQAGLSDVTPTELLEPPLDTVVIDNKDKPNAESGAGGAVGEYQMELLQKLRAEEAKQEQQLAFERQKMAVRGG
jgi:hypothetical protein